MSWFHEAFGEGQLDDTSHDLIHKEGRWSQHEGKDAGPLIWEGDILSNWLRVL